ncbi:MAG: hypothetical protein U5O39_04525 [Gammaproteobacteria bacterium]|nr:hypothetical protein [Gammaproteobacteria bacterium]
MRGIAAPEGSELPFTPDFSGNIRFRYSFGIPALQNMDAYVSGGVTYTGESKSGITGNAFFVEDTAQKVFGQQARVWKSNARVAISLAAAARLSRMPATFRMPIPWSTWP